MKKLPLDHLSLHHYGALHAVMPSPHNDANVWPRRRRRRPWWNSPRRRRQFSFSSMHFFTPTLFVVVLAIFLLPQRKGGGEVPETGMRVGGLPASAAQLRQRSVPDGSYCNHPACFVCCSGATYCHTRRRRLAELRLRKISVLQPMGRVASTVQTMGRHRRRDPSITACAFASHDQSETNENHENHSAGDSSGSDDGDDDDDETSRSRAARRPYRNRSKAWTERYRRLLPYESARRSVLGLSLRSKTEWDEYVANGKVHHGTYLPNHPDEMYPEEWSSWEEFLGLMRPYDEARDVVSNVLGLASMDEYETFVDADRTREELLRIPAKPHKFYKRKGWVSFDHFFGREEETLYFPTTSQGNEKKESGENEEASGEEKDEDEA